MLEERFKSEESKKEWANNVAQEAEDAVKRGKMKGVYEATRRLCSEPPKGIDMVRNKAGKLLANEVEVQQRLNEHFEKLLNRPNPEQVPNVTFNIEVIEEILSDPITKVEIRGAITSMSAGIALGVDGI